MKSFILVLLELTLFQLRGCSHAQCDASPNFFPKSKHSILGFQMRYHLFLDSFAKMMKIENRKNQLHDRTWATEGNCRYITIINYFIILQVYKIIKKNCKGAIGMPLGIQIVGRRYQEELILAVMMQLDQVSEFQNARKWWINFFQKIYDSFFKHKFMWNGMILPNISYCTKKVTCIVQKAFHCPLWQKKAIFISKQLETWILNFTKHYFFNQNWSKYFVFDIRMI